MRLSPKEKTELEIKQSRNGDGIFAKRDFSDTEVIFEVTGIFISGDEDENIDEQTRDNAYRYDADRYISPKGRIGDMLNHSCNPNAKVTKQGKKLLIVAIKKVALGKEVTIDYSTIIASDDSWKMTCNCGSKQCRMKIGKFNSLPNHSKEKYIKLNIVPSYILQL